MNDNDYQEFDEYDEKHDDTNNYVSVRHTTTAHEVMDQPGYLDARKTGPLINPTVSREELDTWEMLSVVATQNHLDLLEYSLFGVDVICEYIDPDERKRDTILINKRRSFCNPRDACLQSRVVCWDGLGL